MTLSIVRWLHLLAASVWVGGLITLAALVPALRKAGAERELLRAAARAFGRLSWAAMAIAIATGLGQVVLMGFPWSYGKLHWKMTAVGAAVLIAAGHQLTAKTSSPVVRGIVEGLMLLAALAIVAAAVAI